MDRIRNFGFILKNLERLYTKRFEMLAQELSLTLAQCKALFNLARNQGISQKRLAEICEIEPMTLVRILDRMEADGWVERRPDPNDRRARTLYVTSGATPILEQIDKLSAQMRAEALAGLNAEQRNQLMGLLEHVYQNLVSTKVEPLAAAARPATALPIRKKAQ
ncbi:MarR family winged helix-turn-helix transcriptional regulator [Peristeroidobacter soli]|uniref:MarR family winged helix-turn-helix transcriptional regulator n=1 Tax=Peristeroidobacter soli TaxID=2497877 RepID=UPI00101C5A4F|nr:MarR family transcriptional regulator [Peristeroidobacter soli]